MKKIIAIAALVLGTSGLANAQSVNYKEVDRSRDVVKATRTDGTTETFRRTNTGAVPYTQKFNQVVNGEHNAYNPTFHDVQGVLRRGWYLGIGADGGWNFSNSNVVGGPNLLLGGYWGPWSLEAAFLCLFNNEYPMDGTAAGDHYISPGARLMVGYDLWSSDMYDQRVTLLVGGAYLHQKTDYRSAQFESSNYGVSVCAQLRYSKTFGRWNVFGGPEFLTFPQVKAQGGRQQWQPVVGIHLGLSFRGNK